MRRLRKARGFNFPMKHESSGYILLNKPPGITSFEALRDVKRAFAPAKVGHTGTLDKFAAGLLLALVGRAVKLASWFSQSDKQYEGTIKFGVETDTLDPEGVPVAEGDPPQPARLEAALSEFRGEIIQTPPAYSAIHIHGKRASALARQGKAVEMPRRVVRVYRLELRSYNPPTAAFVVHCSKGTYIRSLARDIAVAAGSRAHLTALTRTAIGGFHLSHAEGLVLKPVDRKTLGLMGLSCYSVSEETALKIRHGKPLPDLMEKMEKMEKMKEMKEIKESGGISHAGNAGGVFGPDDTLLALVDLPPTGGRPVLKRVFCPP